MSPTSDLGTVTWRKSSHSDVGRNNCVEVTDGLPRRCLRGRWTGSIEYAHGMEDSTDRQ